METLSIRQHSKVHTDKKSLKFITEQRVMGEEKQKWLSKLLGYDFEVKYKPGKDNSAADSLSRQMQYSQLTTVQCDAWVGLENQIQKDERLTRIVHALLIDPLSQKGFQIKGGRLYHDGRIVVPKGSPRIIGFLMNSMILQWGDILDASELRKELLLSSIGKV